MEKEYTVKDKPAERGIKVNNIISSLMLSVMGWVGYNIDEIKESLSQIRVDDAVMQSEIKHLHFQFKNHIDDCEKKFEQLGINSARQRGGTPK